MADVAILEALAVRSKYGGGVVPPRHTDSGSVRARSDSVTHWSGQTQRALQDQYALGLAAQ